MPQRLFMTISNSNNSPAIVAQQVAAQNAALNPTKQKSSALHAPMIERIHNARPGCGSCGKKA